MIKISGLDQLQRQLNDAQKALESLHGDLGEVNFDPNDPASIEEAIQSVEKLIDDKIVGFENNQIIKQLADEMKEHYRQAIIYRASESRLQDGD